MNATKTKTRTKKVSKDQAAAMMKRKMPCANEGDFTAFLDAQYADGVTKDFGELMERFLDTPIPFVPVEG